MEKAKRVFAILGLIWVVGILFAQTFPRTWLIWHTYGLNVWFHLSGALHGSKESVIWLVVFSVVPACLILLVVFAGIGARSVVLWGIKKARG